MMRKIPSFITILLLLVDCSFSQEEIVKDYDGNIYHTVEIGNQVWMTENLMVVHYNDGSPIPFIMDDNIWSTIKNGAYCIPGDNSDKYKETYGVLYNYYVIADNRGICPDGWRIPTKEDWLELEKFLGGKDIAGAKLKSDSDDVWKSGDITETCGFDALPAGGRGRVRGIGEIGNYATWWTSTIKDENFTWHWGVHPDRKSTRSNPGNNNSGFSIRLIKCK